MTIFEERITELAIKLRSTKNEKQREEINVELRRAIVEELQITNDLSSFLKTIDSNFQQYFVVTDAMAKVLVDKPDEFADQLFNLLKANIDKSLIYQLLARLIISQKKELALKWFSHLCYKITDGCTKRPAKSILQRLRTAFCFMPDIKEKPVESVLGFNSLTVEVLLCLFDLVCDISSGKPAIKDVLLREGVLRKASSVWVRLSGKAQLDFAHSLRKMISGRQINYFVPSTENPIDLSNDFIAAIGLEKNANADTHEDKPFTAEGIDQAKEISITKIKHDTKSTTAHVEIHKTSDSSQAESYLTSLGIIVKDLKEQIDFLTHSKRKLEIKITELNYEINELQKIKSNLSEIIENKDSEIDSLKDQLEHQKTEYEGKIERIVEEYRDSIQRELSQFRNRLVYDLQPIVNDIFALDNIEDVSQKNYTLIRLIQALLRTLKSSHGVELNYE